MKYCTKCNKQFDTVGNFCPQCGSQLIEAATTVFCPNCGKKLEAGAMFCDGCGSSLNESSSNNSVRNYGAQAEPVKQNKSKVLLVGIVLLLIVVIGGAGYIVSKNTEKIAQYIPEPILNVLGIEKHEESGVENTNQIGNNVNNGNNAAINGTMPNSGNLQNSNTVPPTPQPIPQPNPTPPYPSPISPTPNVSAPVAPTQDIYRYIVMKDQFDREIADLAKDINSYTATNKNFRWADHLISRGQNIQNRILMERNNLINANVNNIALKNQLLVVIDTEVGRISGLVNGMMNSKNGGDYLPEFRKGTDAAYRFDAADAELRKMQAVYTPVQR